MSRRWIAILLPLFAGVLPGVASIPALAQDGATGSPPERVDLTVTVPPMRSTEEECERQRESAIVSGEIVVCGGRDVPDQRITSRSEAQDRYAAATAFRDAPATPNVDGPGIFRGPATVSGLCIPGIFNCPKPPALIVDVTKLPQAPPGSDADRIARGLKPLGEEAASVAEAADAQQRTELGLPASPSGSAAPAAPQ